MGLREKVAEFKRQRDEVWSSLDAAKTDLRTLKSLPQSPQRDEEVRQKQKLIEDLESELGWLIGVIDAAKPS